MFNPLKSIKMFKTKTNEVHTTTDYFLFKALDGNRNLNLLHLNRLKKSIQENYLYTIIIVNEKYEIIDGQHRFNVIKELKLPLNYIIIDGYGINEVQILNRNSKTWNCDDYLDGYINLKYPDYIKYKEFKNKYKFGHRETLSLLTNSIGCGVNEFYSGNFNIRDFKLATDYADKITSLKKSQLQSLFTLPSENRGLSKRYRLA